MVNIRSTWDIHPTKTNPTRAETLVGTVAVGSVLEVVGQIKGVAGDSASGVFFVAKGGEFLRLQGAGQVELNPKFNSIDPEGVYFVYKNYAEIIGVKP